MSVNYSSFEIILYFQYILDVVGDTAKGIYRSGSIPLIRPLSSGQQSYDTKPLEWPLTEPMIKLEAMDQACFLHFLFFKRIRVKVNSHKIVNKLRCIQRACYSHS